MMRAPSLPDVPVILADPDEYSRRLMREMLRAARIRRIHEVVTAHALADKIHGLGPAVAFVDLELPALGDKSIAPVLEPFLVRSIGMSRRVTLELACTAGKMFAGGLLVKPFTPSALWTRLVVLVDGMTEIEQGQAGNELANQARRLLGGAGAG